MQNRTLTPQENSSQSAPQSNGLEAHSRRWTVRVVALLMVVQAVGLTVTTVLYLSRVNWIREQALTGLSSGAVDTILFSILSIPLAFFGGKTVLGLLRRTRGAWLQAMVIQALLLVFALTSYVIEEANNLTYWTLVSCIIVVLYLNTHEIRASFHAGATDAHDASLLFGESDTPQTTASATTTESQLNQTPHAAASPARPDDVEKRPDSEDTPMPPHSPINKTRSDGEGA